MMISSAVAHAGVLMKNYVSDFDAKILQRDFTIDDV
jgi:hypothetical protein